MSGPFVGLQMGAEPFFAQPPAAIFDRLSERAGVTSVQVNAYDYYGWNQAKGTSPVHVRWNPDRYRGIGFAQAETPHLAHAGRDVFDEIIPAAAERGISVHARILEGFRPATSQLIPGFAQVLQVDAEGRRTHLPCWNHPAYRAWWLATVEDLIREHPLDGLLLGPERDGPLGPLLHDAVVPGCFCPHCEHRARADGVDPRRAREGMLALRDLIAADVVPGEGMSAAIMRCYLRFPEILHWERLQAEAKWSLHAEIAGLARTLRPGFRVGLHICMYSLSWDLTARATTDYAMLAGIFDYLKPSTYWDVNHARLARWIPKAQRTCFKGLSAETIYRVLLEGFGHEPADEPEWMSLAQARCSPAWIRREVARCVAAADGRAAVYSGIGIDVPHPDLPPVDPADIEASVAASFAGGADGLLLSREYEFMRDGSLDAVGRAVARQRQDAA